MKKKREKLVRTTICLQENLLEPAKRIARKQGTTLSEVLRQAVRAYLDDEIEIEKEAIRRMQYRLAADRMDVETK